MLRIVSTPSQALDNIRKFDTELAGSPNLQGRLAYARSWYAHRDAAGEPWRFAPSKFVGYEGISARSYLESADESDGRRTEAQLQLYFQLVDPTAPLCGELNSALVAFLARYGKAPSTKTRINVLRSRRGLQSDVDTTNDGFDAIVNLMVEVARTLPTQHFKQFRERLEDAWT